MQNTIPKELDRNWKIWNFYQIYTFQWRHQYLSRYEVNIWHTLIICGHNQYSLLCILVLKGINILNHTISHIFYYILQKIIKGGESL